MSDLIDPFEHTITDQSGKERTFLLSKYPAYTGREIMAKYPTSNVPKLGDYAVSEEVAIRSLSFVAVITEAGPLRLQTKALQENHTGDWETLVALEWAQIKYNTSFFKEGRSSDFFASIAPKLQAWTSQILTALSAQSSTAGKPPSTN